MDIPPAAVGQDDRVCVLRVAALCHGDAAQEQQCQQAEQEGFGLQRNRSPNAGMTLIISDVSANEKVGCTACIAPYTPLFE